MADTIDEDIHTPCTALAIETSTPPTDHDL